MFVVDMHCASTQLIVSITMQDLASGTQFCCQSCKTGILDTTHAAVGVSIHPEVPSAAA